MVPKQSTLGTGTQDARREISQYLIPEKIEFSTPRPGGVREKRFSRRATGKRFSRTPEGKKFSYRRDKKKNIFYLKEIGKTASRDAKSPKPRGGPKTDTPYLRGTRKRFFASRDEIRVDPIFFRVARRDPYRALCSGT